MPFVEYTDDLRAGLIESTQSDVTLASPRAILDGINTVKSAGSPNIVARNITLTAGNNGISSDPNRISGAGGVGTPGDFLEIEVNADGTDAAGHIGVLNVTDTQVARAATFPTLPLADTSDVLGAPTGTYGVFLTQTSGDLTIAKVETNADASLATDAGSIVDGRGNGGGINTADTILPPNVIADDVDLLAQGGSIGAADGTNDLKVYSSANDSSGAYCTRTFGLGYQDANYADATAAERAVTATCHLAAQAGGSVYITETPGVSGVAAPMDVLLALAKNGSVRLTTTETGIDGTGVPGCPATGVAACQAGSPTAGNDILLIHGGTTLVLENTLQTQWGAGSGPAGYWTIPASNGLIEAQYGDVTLRSADDIVTDPSSQILAVTSPTDAHPGNGGDPNTPADATGNIDIHGDYHPGLTDTSTGDGTVIVLRGTITPGVGGLTRVFGNENADSITFDQTYLGGDTRAYGSAATTGQNAFAPGGDGEDTFTVYKLQSMITGTTLSLDGQDGTDHYIVWTHGTQQTVTTGYVVNVLDSGAEANGVDTLDVYGANGPNDGYVPGTQTPYATDDIFLLRSASSIPDESAARPSVYCGLVAGTCTNAPAYVAVLHPTNVTPGEDYLTAVQASDYQGVVERVNYDNAVNGRFSVDGLGGNDYFAVDDNAATTTLDGGDGNDTFQIGQIYGMQRDDSESGLQPPDYFATIATTRGYLSRGTSEPLVAEGGSGDDTFTVYSNQAALRLEGDDGNDLFLVQAFALAETTNGQLVMGPLFTGSVSVTGGTNASDCAQNQGTASCGTISRTDSGSFITDGFKVGQTLVMAGSGTGDDNNAGHAYTITAVTAGKLTLDQVLPAAGTFAAVSISSGPIARGTLVVDAAAGTITRTDNGDFNADGFVVGQTIALAGTATSDDNLAGVPYSITAISADGKTITVSPAVPLTASGTYAGATITAVLPTPLLTSGFSTAAQTDVRTGDGNNQVEYNVNAPVSVDGGSGFNKLVVLGTEFADHIVVTDQGVFGGGLEVSYRNIQVLEIDALEGDDTIDVLSTAPGMAVRVLGGLGSDTINVAGDVVGDVVSKDVNGTSSTINHEVTSTDPAYNGIVAPGINVDVARATQGNVIITETNGGTDVRRDGDCGSILDGCAVAGNALDSYTVQLANKPTSDVWITISAPMSPQDQPGADTVYLCSGTAADCSSGSDYYETVIIDGVPTRVAVRAIVLHFTADDYNVAQTVWVAAANDTAPQGDIVVAVSSSVISTDPAYANDVVRNVEVTVHDNLTPGIAIVQTDGDTTVIKGTPTTELTDTFTVAPLSKPSGTVTYTITPSDAFVVLSGTGLTPGPLVNGVPTSYTLSFNATTYLTPVTITVTAVNDFVRTDPHYTTLAFTQTGNASVNQTLEVLVLDDNTPGVYVAQTGGSTVVSAGSNPAGDSYSVRLLSAPAPGTTVTVGAITDGQTNITAANCATPTLGTVCLESVGHQGTTALFSGNVTVSGNTIMLATGSELQSFITAGFAIGQQLVLSGTGTDDNPCANQSCSNAYVITGVTATTLTLSHALATNGTFGPYAMQGASAVQLSRVVPSGLFTGPTTYATGLDPVTGLTVGILTRTDGASWLDNGFLEGQLVQFSGVSGTFKIQSIFGSNLSEMSFTVVSVPGMLASSTSLSVTEVAPVVTFDDTNWWKPVDVEVSADPSFYVSPQRSDLLTFPKQPHYLSGIQGPLQVDGGTGGEQHALESAVIMPTEINTPPFGIAQQPSEAKQIDTLNIYDDGSHEDQSGTLTSTALTGFGMGPSLTFPGTTSWGEPNSFPGGISYGTISVDPISHQFETNNSTSTIEVLNIMLGQGNDTLNIESTLVQGADQARDDKLPNGIPALAGALTLVQGGGNSLLAVTGQFDLTAGSVTRDDGQSWTTAGFAVGQQVNVPGYAVGAFTITGFSGANGETMLLSGGTLTAKAGVGGTVSVYDPLQANTGFERIGGDHITVTGGGGSSSPLVIYGDTSQDGVWYSGDPNEQSGHVFGPKPTTEPVGNDPNFVFPLAQPFQYSGNDVIDASGLDAGLPANQLPSVGVTIYGGPGNDTLIGSQAGDIIAGGSGNDTIDGLRGNDLIYGDNGINVDVTTRVLSVTSVNGSALPDADSLFAGHDLIQGDGPGSAPDNTTGATSSQDVIFGDLGQVTQDVQGKRFWYQDASGNFVETDTRPQALQTTGLLMDLATVNPQDGVSDTIDGNLGNDFLFGGGGGDTISGSDGNDLVFGDFGSVDCVRNPSGSTCIDPAERPAPPTSTGACCRSTSRSTTTRSPGRRSSPQQSANWGNDLISRRQRRRHPDRRRRLRPDQRRRGRRRPHRRQ